MGDGLAGDETGVLVKQLQERGVALLRHDTAASGSFFGETEPRRRIGVLDGQISRKHAQRQCARHRNAGELDTQILNRDLA